MGKANKRGRDSILRSQKQKKETIPRENGSKGGDHSTRISDGSRKAEVAISLWCPIYGRRLFLKKAGEGLYS